jgi:hypothetical protein
VDAANTALRAGELRVVEYEVGPAGAGGKRLADLPYGEGEFALVLERGASSVVATGQQTLGPGDRLWCARPLQGASDLAALLVERPRTAALP